MNIHYTIQCNLSQDSKLHGHLREDFIFDNKQVSISWR